MKVLSYIKQLKLPKLLIEAVLIFGSVYAAFVLDNVRARRFERELLHQKLEAHLKVMELDSITFESRLLGNIPTHTNEGLQKSIENHKKALQLLESQTKAAYLEVYNLHKSGELFWRVIQSATKSQHKLDVISESYDHLIMLDSTRHFIEKYTYHTWVMNQFASNADKHIDDLGRFARENYFVFSPLENERDMLAFVSHPYYYNTIKSHLSTLNILFGMRADYMKDFTEMKNGFVEEMKQQKAKL